MKALKSNCIFGIVIGLLIVAAGLYLAFGFSGSYIGNDSGTAEFGADFYTNQYKATRNAATNVENLGLFTRDVAQFGFRAGGLVVAGLGLAISCLFAVKLEEAKHREELAARAGGNPGVPAYSVPGGIPQGNPYDNGMAVQQNPTDFGQNV